MEGIFFDVFGEMLAELVVPVEGPTLMSMETGKRSAMRVSGISTLLCHRIDHLLKGVAWHGPGFCRS